MGGTTSTQPPPVASQWELNVESRIGDGLRVVRSEPITDYELDELWEAYMRMMGPRPALPHEVSYESRTLEDGGILTSTGFDAQGVAGVPQQGTMMRHMLHYVDTEKREVVCHIYQGQTEFSDAEKESSSVVRFLKDPFQIEFSAEEYATRRSGLAQKAVMDFLLNMLGTSARSYEDAESPSGGGIKSVMTDPITDKPHTVESFINWFRPVIQELTQGTLQPDGSILEEKFLWGIMATYYKRYTFDFANGQVVTYEYGLDSSQTTPSEVFFLKVHEDPFRLELYSLTQDRKLVDHNAKAAVEVFLVQLVMMVKR